MNAKQLELPLERRDTFIVCPRCQTCCSRVQDSRPRCLRDLPMLAHPVVLWLHLRRFACAACHHRPWEKSETFGEHVKWTTRLYQQVRQAYVHGCPCRALARRYGLSERTVCRWTFERSRGGRPRKLGRAIGIDEYARRKGHRYNTLIVNVDTGKPIATFKGRRAEEVIAWFQSRPQAERDQVEVVVMDMSGSLPTLRSAHRVENKEIRVDIDPRRIPRKMLEKPIPQQEEPDAWIFSVSMPGLNCQNSV